MKKICLICLIISMVFTICGCSDGSYPRMSLDKNTIYYNGNTYYINSTREHDFFLHYEEKAVPETGERIGISIYLDAIALHNYGVGDNILRVTGMGASLSFYFKEGFEFPKYNEVALSKLLTTDDDIVEIPKDKDVSWCDIIDYDTYIEISEYPECLTGVYGEIKDSTLGAYFHTGHFYLYLIDDAVYIETDRLLRSTTGHAVFYKISDEYQQIFKDFKDIKQML